MKIGIMTLWNTEHNYGAVLQCYALQEFLRRKGHEPFLIKYRDAPSHYIDFRHISPQKIIRYIRRLYGRHRWPAVCDEPRFFRDFRERYMGQTQREYIGYEDLKNNAPDADIYIVGSDQVWNFYNISLKICRGRIHAFFLDFGMKETYRLAYAASWDEKYVTAEQLGEIKKLIHNFQYVSVREESGLKLCRKCGIDNAEWVVDPTLLLSDMDYRDLYRDERNRVRRIEEKYLLIYRVMVRKQSMDIEGIQRFAREKGLRVIYISEDGTNDAYEKYYPTIPEWLYLMDNAEYIVTNSYHGTVFSLIFHKQYGTMPMTGYEEGINTRMKALWRIFHTEERFLADGDFHILDQPYQAMLQCPQNRFEEIIGGLRS